MNHVNIAKLNVHHLGFKHGFLFIQYSKPPIKNLNNCIIRVNRQIFDAPIILCIGYSKKPTYIHTHIQCYVQGCIQVLVQSLSVQC